MPSKPHNIAEIQIARAPAIREVLLDVMVYRGSKNRNAKL
jgi:hypothetical protein